MRHAAHGGQDRRQAASRQRREVLTPVNPGGPRPPDIQPQTPRPGATITPPCPHPHALPGWAVVGLIGAPPGWGSAGLSARLVWGAAPPGEGVKGEGSPVGAPAGGALDPLGTHAAHAFPPRRRRHSPACRPGGRRWLGDYSGPPGWGSAGLSARLLWGAAPLRARASALAGGGYWAGSRFRAAAPAAPRAIPGGPRGSTRGRGGR